MAAKARSHALGWAVARLRMPETSPSATPSRRSNSAAVVGPVRTWRIPGGTNSGRPTLGESPAERGDSARLRMASGIYLHGTNGKLTPLVYLNVTYGQLFVTQLSHLTEAS